LLLISVPLKWSFKEKELGFKLERIKSQVCMA
jgi:hypothetical protein